MENNNNTYTVSNIDGAGRGLLAARDIRAGELILKASPAALGELSLIKMTPVTRENYFAGPQPSAEYTQCVECWKTINNTPYSCPRCRLPCCDFNCSQGKLHR